MLFSSLGESCFRKCFRKACRSQKADQKEAKMDPKRLPIKQLLLPCRFCKIVLPLKAGAHFTTSLGYHGEHNGFQKGCRKANAEKGPKNSEKKAFGCPLEELWEATLALF